MFTDLFRQYDPCFFRGVIYPINETDIPAHTEFRRLCGCYTALEYYAKEHLPFRLELGLNAQSIVEKLKEEGLFDTFNDMKWLYEGYEYERAPINAFEAAWLSSRSIS